MKIISWNVNGIKSTFERGCLDKLIKNQKPDILCIQEIRTKNENVLKIFEEYDYIVYPYAATNSGYYGTAICTKIEPLSNIKGIGDTEFDNEGRVIMLEFENFYLFNVYAPTGTATRKRNQKDSFNRKCEFFDKLKDYAYNLNKPSIICGDFNRVSKEIDANNISNLKRTGFAPREQEWFKEILTKYVDAFRKFNPEGDKYTWWPYREGFRDENKGCRFDYFLVSNNFESKIRGSSILDNYLVSDNNESCSDHAPILLKLELNR